MWESEQQAKEDGDTRPLEVVGDNDSDREGLLFVHARILAGPTVDER